jgi:hypothetical protein
MVVRSFYQVGISLSLSLSLSQLAATCLKTPEVWDSCCS